MAVEGPKLAPFNPTALVTVTSLATFNQSQRTPLLPLLPLSLHILFPAPPPTTPFPCSKDAIEAALAEMMLTEKDVLFDLGCGDGRVLLEAAVRTPCSKLVGVEYDAKFVSGMGLGKHETCLFGLWSYMLSCCLPFHSLFFPLLIHFITLPCRWRGLSKP